MSNSVLRDLPHRRDLIDAGERIVTGLEQGCAGPTFQSCVQRFIDFLDAATQSPLSADDVDALYRLADRIIEKVEERLETREDRLPVKGEFVNSIYGIRRRLETMADATPAFRMRRRARARPSSE